MSSPNNNQHCPAGEYYSHLKQRCDKLSTAECIPGSVCTQTLYGRTFVTPNNSWPIEASYEAYMVGANINGPGNNGWFELPAVKNAICTPENKEKVQQSCSANGSIPKNLRRTPEAHQYIMLATAARNCGWGQDLANQCGKKGQRMV